MHGRCCGSTATVVVDIMAAVVTGNVAVGAAVVTGNVGVVVMAEEEEDAAEEGVVVASGARANVCIAVLGEKRG